MNFICKLKTMFQSHYLLYVSKDKISYSCPFILLKSLVSYTCSIILVEQCFSVSIAVKRNMATETIV